MRKSLLEIYALAVCFVIIVCFTVALGVAIYDAVQIADPEFTLSSHEFKRHQNNDEFWKSSECGYENREKKIERPPDEILTKLRLESYQILLASERRNALQSLAISTIILVIDIVVFSVHWRIARRAREANVAA